MKKFLLMAALIVGVVASQLVTAPQAEADVAGVHATIWECEYCGERFNAKPYTHPNDYGKKSGCSSHGGLHHWIAIGYIFSNGNVAYNKK